MVNIEMPLKEGSGKYGCRFILSLSDKIFRTGYTYRISFFVLFFLHHLHLFISPSSWATIWACSDLAVHRKNTFIS